MTSAADLWQRVQEWKAAGWTSRCIAEELNREGHRTPHGRPFTAESVRKLIERAALRASESRAASSAQEEEVTRTLSLGL